MFPEPGKSWNLGEELWDRNIVGQQAEGPGCEYPDSSLFPTCVSLWPKQLEAREQEGLRDESVHVNFRMLPAEPQEALLSNVTTSTYNTHTFLIHTTDHSISKHRTVKKTLWEKNFCWK